MIKYEIAYLYFSDFAEKWILKTFTPVEVTIEELQTTKSSDTILELLAKGWEPINVSKEAYAFKKIYDLASE